LFVTSKLAKIEKTFQGTSKNIKLDSINQLPQVKTKQISNKNTSLLPKIRSRIKPNTRPDENSNLNSSDMTEKGIYYYFKIECI